MLSHGVEIEQDGLVWCHQDVRWFHITVGKLVLAHQGKKPGNVLKRSFHQYRVAVVIERIAPGSVGYVLADKP